MTELTPTQIDALYAFVSKKGVKSTNTSWPKANASTLKLLLKDRLVLLYDVCSQPSCRFFCTSRGFEKPRVADLRICHHNTIQWFCGALLFDDETIRGDYFVSKARSYLGEHVNFEEFQWEIMENWRDEIPNKTIFLQDTTYYEVYIGFPTYLGRWGGQTFMRSMPVDLKENDSKDLS
ncbi:hypothetical protein DTQ70_25270 [Runella sp. SP2]|nr:hypothetical protein DTQ70_25270 [Runella sp. SP2]